MAEESGMKWWIRFVVVPLVGGGGVIALIIAFAGGGGPELGPSPASSQDTLPLVEPEPPPSTIRVRSASFAQTNGNNGCDDAVENVRALCDGLTQCPITPETSNMCVGGRDPSPTNRKALFLNYVCTADSLRLRVDTIPEGVLRTVAC